MFEYELHRITPTRNYMVDHSQDYTAMKNKADQLQQAEHAKHGDDTFIVMQGWGCLYRAAGNVNNYRRQA